jgi:nucleoside-diphosphate-sugar epimerase
VCACWTGCTGAPLAGLLENIEVVHADVRAVDAAMLAGVDAVVHLAGLSNDPTAEWAPEANWQMNAVATERLADACLAAGVRRLTYGSSCSVYDGLPAGTVYDERADAATQRLLDLKHCGEERLLERRAARSARWSAPGYGPRLVPRMR